MRRLVLALDWTPNTTHCGVYVAKEKGYFEQEGLALTLVSPHATEFEMRPCDLLDSEEADFAFGAAECVYGYCTMLPKPKFQAVASVLARDVSRIVTRKADGIDKPSKLDGKYYASSPSRFEGMVVKKMIQNDGGKGTFVQYVAEDRDIFTKFLEGESSAAWVLLHWEGVEASMKGVELNAFALEDYNVPYTYFPVIFGKTEKLEEDPNLVCSFLRACRRGYTDAALDPPAAAEIFINAVAKEHKHHPIHLDVELVHKSQEIVSKYYLAEDGTWGRIERNRVDRCLDWLSENGLLTRLIHSCSTPEGTHPFLELDDEDAPAAVSREEVDSRRTFTNVYLDMC